MRDTPNLALGGAARRNPAPAPRRWPDLRDDTRQGRALTQAQGGSYPAGPGAEAAPRVTAENKRKQGQQWEDDQIRPGALAGGRGAAPWPGSRLRAPAPASRARAPSRCARTVRLLSDGVKRGNEGPYAGGSVCENRSACARPDSHRDFQEEQRGLLAGSVPQGWGRGNSSFPDAAGRFPHTGTCGHALGQPDHRPPRGSPTENPTGSHIYRGGSGAGPSQVV